jgi:hypothetical protein
MTRTQIYLTEGEQRALRALSKATGKTQSDLIRSAIDRMLQDMDVEVRRANLMAACGIWKDRKNLAGVRKLRAGWERRRRRLGL